MSSEDDAAVGGSTELDTRYAEYADLNPLCSFVESEGLTLILDVATAEQAHTTTIMCSFSRSRLIKRWRHCSSW